MKKLLFIPWTFTNGGGSEKILSNIINNLPKNKYKIDILEIEHNSHNPNIDSYINFLGPIINGKTESEGFSLKLLRKIKFTCLKYAPSLISKLYIKSKYDIVISFNYLYPSFLISKLNGKKIAWFHGTIDDLDYSNLKGLSKLKTKYLFNMQKKALKKVDHIISISNATKKSILKIYPEFSSKVIKLYNGYDFQEILEKSKCDSISPIDIVSIGRLDKNKNFSLLIEAISLLKKDFPNINVKILGEGTEKENLLKLIKEKSLEKNIELLGYISNPYPYIKASKLLALTSFSEGFPTVIVEGMALGCPFISTNVGGVSELSNNEQCGLIVSSAKDLAENIDKLLKDKVKLDTMSNNCLNYSNQYSLENYINNICNILNKNN